MSKKQTELQAVSARVQPDELERDILAFWEREKVFQRSLELTQGKPLFTFYDGPPYATGKPHYGHILQSAIKDTVLRYKTMRGYHVPRRVGWDCHGLPVETLVERELGFKTKKDIERFGIEAFNKVCRDTVFRYIDQFTTTLQRMGRWADYEGAYATLDRTYMESEWWVFKKLWEQKLVYQDYRTSPYCIRCATPLSNFEVSSNYKDTTDTAAYILVPIRDHANVFAMIWTTTPWTLPGNVAIAISDKVDYVSVRDGDREIITAKASVSRIFGSTATIVKTWTPAELANLTYELLYSFSSDVPDGRIVVSDHVTAEDGSGLVHIAPAFGEADAALGTRYGLLLINNVDIEGRFMADVVPWAGKKVLNVNDEILTDIETRGLLYKKEKYRHSYPFCWRCDTPLIYYPINSWFIKVTDLKERLLSLNEQINWIPGHVKNGRFAKSIAAAPDWAVSRNRFWSVPIPIWQCDACEQVECIGSLNELLKLTGSPEISDMHRPYVDLLTWKCSHCPGTMTRVPEVLDVWFDSAVMPYAQWHYPFENVERVKENFPADFIVESIEQTRLWFYVLHVVAAAVTNSEQQLGGLSPAYKNVIASGIIFAEDGQKLSKKLKNYPELEPTIQRFGADVLRLYLLSSTTLGEPYRFSEKDLGHLQRNTYNTLWNVYSFFTRYASTHDWTPVAETDSLHILDQWIRARSKEAVRDFMVAADAYRIDQAARLLTTYIDDLSNWYVRRSRERFQRPPVGQENSAFATLHQVLIDTAKLIAPVMPFISEAMYRNLMSSTAGLNQPLSVHLQTLPDIPTLSTEEGGVLAAMKKVREIVAIGLGLRAGQKIKVRQPLATLFLVSPPLAPALVSIIQDELNVKELKFVDVVPQRDTIVTPLNTTSMTVGLETALTEELRAEGLARDLVRQGQVLRRQAKYELNDRITLIVSTKNELVAAAVALYSTMIQEALQAKQIVAESPHEDSGVDIEIHGERVHIGVIK